MGVQNMRYAAVNLSSTTFNVYKDRVPGSIYTGGVTAGGEIIGKIYPYEFYIVLPNDSPYLTSFKIYFRNVQGVGEYGYIETSKGTTFGDYEWNAHQHPYHYYNASGNVLVESVKTVPINNYVHRVFTVSQPVSYRAPNGTILGVLAAGTEIACRSSTTGQTYVDNMIFYYKRTPPGSWTKMNATVDYAFVDLNITSGNMPYNRAIK